MELQLKGDPRLVLSRAEALGLSGLLWDLGSTVKETTGDPDCVAAEVYHEAASIESKLGLPSWPTDTTTRRALADFYHAAAVELQEDSSVVGRLRLAPNLDVRIAAAHQLLRLLKRVIAAMGTDGVGLRAVGISSRAVAWTQAMSAALHGSGAVAEDNLDNEALLTVLNETVQLLREDNELSEKRPV
jgi:hypothetical protein